MSTTEIKVGGLGGQGVILNAMIIGRAASIHDRKYATLTQSFGPEARGSACSAGLIISDEPVAYPYLTRPDILVVMSQEAYMKFSPELAEGGLLLYEEDLVKPIGLDPSITGVGIPATRFAEELGRKMVLNIVMVGFFAAVTKLIDNEAMIAAVKESVPEGTEELNLKAYHKGYAYGQAVPSPA
jgi:2-oxoglutarate ferredoxin oxidoreductase subunit gamma